MKDKLFIVRAYSEDNPKRATIPFVLGSATLLSGLESHFSPDLGRLYGQEEVREERNELPING
jgi:hypothetical protein